MAKKTYDIPGIPRIIETEDGTFEVTFSDGGYWLDSLHAAIVFAIGNKNNKPIDRVRTAAFLLGVSSDK